MRQATIVGFTAFDLAHVWQTRFVARGDGSAERLGHGIHGARHWGGFHDGAGRWGPAPTQPGPRQIGPSKPFLGCGLHSRNAPTNMVASFWETNRGGSCLGRFLEHLSLKPGRWGVACATSSGDEPVTPPRHLLAKAKKASDRACDAGEPKVTPGTSPSSGYV